MNVTPEQLGNWVRIGQAVVPAVAPMAPAFVDAARANGSYRLTRMLGRAVIGGFGVYVFTGERNVVGIATRAVAAMTMVELADLVWDVLSGRKS